MTLSPSDFVLMAFSISLRQIGGQVAKEMTDRHLRRRRHDKLERMVAAELLSRGVSFDSMMLHQLSDNVPPRVTADVVKRVADRIEQFMKMTGGAGGIFDQTVE